uniref:Uncharacterized protein n=1 Tax=Picea glauca TaxID=3330 RepID=A0A101LWE5_PICGL|nr:hypothetical protein ABT39_MTgene1677 [Picea glauca]
MKCRQPSTFHKGGISQYFFPSDTQMMNLSRTLPTGFFTYKTCQMEMFLFLEEPERYKHAARHKPMIQC